MDEYIELDYAGWGNHPRYTHSQNGDTILRQPWMSDSYWQNMKKNYFAKYPGVLVKDERDNEVTP